MESKSREILNRAMGVVKGISISENLTQKQTELLEGTCNLISQVLDREEELEEPQQ